MIWVDGFDDGVRRGESDYAGAAPRACPARGCRRQGGDLADTLLAIVQRRGAANVFAERQRLDGVVAWKEAATRLRPVSMRFKGQGNHGMELAVRPRGWMYDAGLVSWHPRAGLGQQRQRVVASAG